MLFVCVIISIHAAREGGDCRNKRIYERVYEISIHAAREGGDYKLVYRLMWRKDFNPRRP